MLAVITNYYNPSGRKTKLDNFIKFKEAMTGHPLFIVEAAFGDDRFTLPEDECHLQLRCRDILWQQYRLVNVGIKQLPDQYDQAIWIDCDILFEDPDWYSKMAEALSKYKIVQSYSTVTLLDNGSDTGETKVGVTKEAIKNSQKSTATNMAGNLDLSARFATGFSWGVRRDVIENHGIYDYWITGSCDSAFVIGIWGDWKNSFIKDRLNDKMKSHYMEWAIPFNSYIDGSVSYLDMNINHLWHGVRNYKKRWLCLRDFDPYVDIRIADNGVMEWCSDKPDMHRCCRNMCLNYDVEFNPYL